MRQLTTNNRRDSIWDFMSEIERAFDEAWRSPTASPEGRESGLANFAPAVDLHETPDFYLISVDLPGVSEKDIKIDVTEGRLTISGERNREEQKSEGMFRRFERSYGRFERAFQMPQNADTDKIQARFENGVLEVMVPKSEVAKPRSVKIETGKGGLFSRLLGQKNVEAKQDTGAH